MYKLCVFVPESHLDAVKDALFIAGAGKIGDYDCCCWQVKGQGQFRPLQGSSPYFGKQDKLEVVSEYKLELVCDDSQMREAVMAMKQTHPYDEPAYDVVKLENF